MIVPVMAGDRVGSSIVLTVSGSQNACPFTLLGIKSRFGDRGNRAGIGR